MTPTLCWELFKGQKLSQNVMFIFLHGGKRERIPPDVRKLLCLWGDLALKYSGWTKTIF